jgi:prophage maintenance system killer protein
LASTATFLHINGIEITTAENDDVYDLVMHIATDNPPLAEIVSGLRDLLPR